MKLPRVTVTHLPSGVLASSNLWGYAYENRREAMRMLRSKLAAPASPFTNRTYVLDSEPQDQLREFDEKYG